MRPLAVFDIDGVLADVRHRVHLLETEPADWRAFFAAAVDDVPLETGVALLREAAGDCEIAYLTGRPELCRHDTRTWLAEQGLPKGRLVMRANADRRPAKVAKPLWLRRLAGTRVVAIVVDDDAFVCRAYERAGWPVLHATWAEQLPALDHAQETDGRT